MSIQASIPGFKLPTELETEFPTSTNFQIVLCNDTRISFDITAPDVSGSTITSTAHGLVDDQVVTTDASLGANWVADATKYVVNATANTFQVSNSVGGTALTLTGASATITDLPLVLPTLQNPPETAIANYKFPPNLAAYVAKEISDYDGLTNRPVTTRVAGAVFDQGTGEAYIDLQTLTLDNTGGLITIVYDTILVLVGGSTTPGNTTGTLLRVIQNPATDSIGQSAQRELKIRARKSVAGTRA